MDIHPSTIREPLISEWPEPQKTLHEKAKVPALLATNSMTVCFPGARVALMPKSGRLKPWVVSTLSIVSLTLSPLLTRISEGVKENCLATMENSFVSFAAGLGDCPTEGVEPGGTEGEAPTVPLAIGEAEGAGVTVALGELVQPASKNEADKRKNNERTLNLFKAIKTHLNLL